MNHETQRLLFAAGRGARVQYYEKAVPGLWLPGQWTDTNLLLVPNGKAFCERRIHPEDVHLQYGPISTELRRISVEYETNGALRCWTDMTGTAMTMANAYCWLEEVYAFPSSDFDRSEHAVMPWLYAFAAELAADEGL